MINWDSLDEFADDEPRLPLIGETVQQDRTGVILCVTDVSLGEVKVKPVKAERRSFRVALETFWGRYTSMNY